MRFWHVCSRFGHAPVTDLSCVAHLVTHSDALDGATRGLALHYRDRDVPDRDTCAVTCLDCAAAEMISSIVSNATRNLHLPTAVATGPVPAVPRAGTWCLS